MQDPACQWPAGYDTQHGALELCASPGPHQHVQRGRGEQRGAYVDDDERRTGCLHQPPQISFDVADGLGIEDLVQFHDQPTVNVMADKYHGNLTK
jgi:hypothetical protein